MRYERILQALALEPWAMQQEKLSAVCEVVASRIIAGNPVDAKFTAAQDRKVAAQSGNVGVIPIHGVVGNRMSMVSNSSGGFSAEMAAAQFKAMLSNDDVKTIILDIDSPGGAVSGVPELHAAIMAGRGVKPIIAHVNALAASAAYWIASAADEIVVTPSGTVGSVGVYTMHQDISGYLEKEGIKMSIFDEGDFKTEGHPYGPLSEEAQEVIQSRVKEAYEMFVNDLAKGRGVDAKTVLDNYGQGRAFGAKEAIKRGMADRIGTFEETITRFGVNTDRRKAESLEPKQRSIAHMKRKAKVIALQTA